MWKQKPAALKCKLQTHKKKKHKQTKTWGADVTHKNENLQRWSAKQKKKPEHSWGTNVAKKWKYVLSCSSGLQVFVSVCCTCTSGLQAFVFTLGTPVPTQKTALTRTWTEGFCYSTLCPLSVLKEEIQQIFLFEHWHAQQFNAKPHNVICFHFIITWRSARKCSVWVLTSTIK